MAESRRHARILVSERVHRILRTMDSFRVGGGSTDDPAFPVLADAERCLGIYRNTAGTLAGAIVVTDRGLLLQRSRGWEFIAYGDLAAVDTEGSSKRRVSALMLTLQDGKRRRLPVAGGTDRFRDAFEWKRFLLRVIEDGRPAPS